MVEDAEDQILELLDKHDIETAILSGASVHFDRGFIKNWMWRLDQRLSHRHFDVSTLRMFLTARVFTLTVNAHARQFTELWKMSKTHTNCFARMLS